MEIVARELDNDTITYSNSLVTVSSYFIQRKQDLHVHVSCRMLRDTWVDVMYIANNSIEVKEVQYGNFDVKSLEYGDATQVSTNKAKESSEWRISA